MGKFLPHDSIANGSFNVSYNIVLPEFKVWEDLLTNSEEVLTLLVARLETDYLALNQKMRKAYASKDVEPGSFQHKQCFLVLCCCVCVCACSKPS